MTRVLVTGATGFVGRHCVPRLVSRGFAVHTVASRHRAPLEGSVPHDVNLLDPLATRALVGDVRPDLLLHLAWYAVPGLYWTADANFAWLSASIELVRAFVEAGGRRFVGVGTCAEYDWQHGRCREDDTPCRPTTVYGACKHALCLVSSVIARQAALSAAWARLFFIYGPHEAPARLVPSVIRPLLNGQRARCTAGEQIRDFLYVEDAAAALVALLVSDVRGAVNVASGAGIAIRDLAVEIADQLEQPGLLELGALPARANDPALLTADTGRLNAEVGWQPAWTLVRGVQASISWWPVASDARRRPDPLRQA